MTGSRTPRRFLTRRGGYTLIEMLLVVSGTAAVVSLGATTVVSVRRAATTARAAAESGPALSRLHRTLRQDAADAVAADAGGDGLTLTAADGASILYEAEGDAVRRTVAGPRAGRDLFPVGGTGFRWAAEPGPGGTRVAVRFDFRAGPHDRAGGPAAELAAWLPPAAADAGGDE